MNADALNADDVVPVGERGLVPAGTVVRVTYEGSYSGREHTFEAEAVDALPFLHRSASPEDLHMKFRGENGTSYRRVESDGRLTGLHHATRRHDTRMGSVVSVEVVSRPEDEDDAREQVLADGRSLADDVDGFSTSNLNVHEDAFDPGTYSLRVHLPNRRLSAPLMAAVARRGWDLEYLGPEHEDRGAHVWLVLREGDA